MLPIEPHFSSLQSTIAAARAAPLSAKKALLAALLLDAYADQLFAASGDDDILVFRETLAHNSPALALLFALAAQRDTGPRLVTEAVDIPIADYPTLSTADFMVSLYNRHTVQRVLIADGPARHDVHQVLAEAMAALRG